MSSEKISESNVFRDWDEYNKEREEYVKAIAILAEIREKLEGYAYGDVKVDLDTLENLKEQYALLLNNSQNFLLKCSDTTNLVFSLNTNLEIPSDFESKLLKASKVCDQAMAKRGPLMRGIALYEFKFFITGTLFGAILAAIFYL